MRVAAVLMGNEAVVWMLLEEVLFSFVEDIKVYRRVKMENTYTDRWALHVSWKAFECSTERLAIADVHAGPLRGV